MNLPISPTPPVERKERFLPPTAPSPFLAEIYVYVGNEHVAKFAIEHGEYLIGRDESCHLHVDAERVSRHHARLVFSAYELVVEDLDSSNGIFIDGVQVQLPTRVRPDQEIQMGAARLYVQLNEATARQLAAAMWDADLGLAPVRQQLDGPRYKVITTIARGGMGVILQARDLRIRRSVAMKVMRSGSQFSRESVLRFIDEAQLTGQLDHPNIVPVHELGIDEQGESFYTMKFVRGITLDEVLRGLRHSRAEIVEKYSLAALLTIFQKVCDAMAFAHSKGVVHRDLKPENIMIGSYGQVFVMDWGLAKRLAGDQPVEGSVELDQAITSAPDPERGFQTMFGIVIGTPPYVSPEQARGELDAVDVRSDIYVLGTILYEILTLRQTIRADSLDEMLVRIIEGKIAPPLSFNPPALPRHGAPNTPQNEFALAHCPGGRIPEGLAAVAMKAMALEAAERYATVEEMQADISACQGGFAPKAERANFVRHLLLFVARHRSQVALVVIGALLLQVMAVAFIIQLSNEKNRAVASERRVRESERELGRMVDELRGTAPTFAAEAAALLENKEHEEALEKIDYAIEQVPNEANYHALRGHILQTMLRFSEAVLAYQEALQRNPKHASAKRNLELTEKLRRQIGDDGSVTPAILNQLHASLLEQKRVGEALGVLDQIGRDRKLFFNTWKTAFEKRGLRQRFETREDETLMVDLSKVPLPDLRKLRGAPLSGVNIDDTKLPDVSPLKGLPINTLSLNRTLVRDLSPLIGMPLQTLSMENIPATDLHPLAQLPLESLRLGGTRVEDLSPLSSLRLEDLSMAGCRHLKSIAGLHGMPLQRLDLSRTSISDLTPLTQSPIRELNLQGCVDLIDLRPLMQITTLESVVIPAQCKDVEFLREHPSIKRLSYKRLTQPAYEFWAEYDNKAAQ